MTLRIHGEKIKMEEAIWVEGEAGHVKYGRLMKSMQMLEAWEAEYGQKIRDTKSNTFSNVMKKISGSYCSVVIL